MYSDSQTHSPASEHCPLLVQVNSLISRLVKSSGMIEDLTEEESAWTGRCTLVATEPRFAEIQADPVQI